MECKESFRNEEKVRKVGGRLQSDYYRFRREIEYINAHYFGLFCFLNLTEDVGLIIEALKGELRDLREIFINKAIGDMKAGKISKDKFLSNEAKKRMESAPPEEREKIWERGTRFCLSSLYKKTLEQYKERNSECWIATWRPKPWLEILRTTLFLTPERIEIDGEKFVEVYTDFLAADASETKKIHDQAAEAINRFFNGAFPITKEELSKYFILEYGEVKVNPKSVNLTDYARLGPRTVRKAKKDGGKKK